MTQTPTQMPPRPADYTQATLLDYWTDVGRFLLEGKKIRSFRYMTEDEASAADWPCRAPILELDDDTFIIIATDPECNGPGAMEVLPPGGDHEILGPI